MQSVVIIFLLLYFGTVLFGIMYFRMMRRRDALLLGDITDMVHQLRTPLSGVKWTLKILLDEDVGHDTEAEHELLTKGFAANERMVNLVNDILAVARLESGTLKYHFVPVQFEELIAETIASLNTTAASNGISITFIPPVPPLPKWTVDPEKMRDVIQNILDNAIKYMKKSGVITVAIAMEGNVLHLVIADDGIGIPEEVKQKIFTRFFRAQNAIAAQIDGSGLGLFIAHTIVLAHHGKLWFESVPGGGTAFHLTLPKRS